MIADEHRRSGRPLGIQTTAPVGQHDDTGARSNGRAHSMDHLVRPMAFIEMGTPGEDGRDLARRRRHHAECASMTDDGRLRKAGQVGQLAAADRLTKIIGGCRPAGSEHEGKIELRDLEAIQDCCGSDLGTGVRIRRQAIVRHDSHFSAASLGGLVSLHSQHDQIRTSPAADARARAELGDVIGGSTGHLGRVGKDPDGSGTWSATLEVVEHIDPGSQFAVQRCHADSQFAIQAGVGAFPLIKSVLVPRSDVVQRDEDLIFGFLGQCWQGAIPAFATEGNAPSHGPPRAALRRVRAAAGHLRWIKIASVRRVQHSSEAIWSGPRQGDGRMRR